MYSDYCGTVVSTIFLGMGPGMLFSFPPLNCIHYVGKKKNPDLVHFMHKYFCLFFPYLLHFYSCINISLAKDKPECL